MSSRKSKRLNHGDLKRSSTGKFIKVCSSTIHDHSNSLLAQQLIDLVSRKNILLKNYNKLLQSQIICKECYQFIISESSSKEQESDSEVGNSSCDEDDGMIKYVELGDELSKIIQSDVKELYTNKSVETINDLIDFNHIDWIRERPMELVHLLSKICKIDLNTANEPKLRTLTKIIEMIYFSRNRKLVLPQHFIDNLVGNTCTNSKTYCNYQGAYSPGGSYFTLSSWLNQQARKPIEFPPGLTKAVFDNNQKVGKTYVITGDNKVPTAVMTSNLWITFDEKCGKQNENYLKPEHWMWNVISENEKEQLLELMTNTTHEFRESRDKFISECIVQIQKEQRNGEDSVDDFIKKSHEESHKKKCNDCGIESTVLQRICRNWWKANENFHRTQD